MEEDHSPFGLQDILWAEGKRLWTDSFPRAPVTSPPRSRGGVTFGRPPGRPGIPSRPCRGIDTPVAMGGIGGRRRRGQQRMRWLGGITDSMDMSLSVGLCPGLNVRP